MVVSIPAPGTLPKNEPAGATPLQWGARPPQWGTQQHQQELQPPQQKVNHLGRRSTAEAGPQPPQQDLNHLGRTSTASAGTRTSTGARPSQPGIQPPPRGSRPPPQRLSTSAGPRPPRQDHLPMPIQKPKTKSQKPRAKPKHPKLHAMPGNNQGYPQTNPETRPKP
ncbi:hypothetical protein VTK56DRAFT_410 [Thermocarpiscus australiensis]